MESVKSPKKQMFDVESFLRDQGATVTGVTPEGSVRFKPMDSDQEQVFDVKSFLKDQGADSAQFDFKYNSPNSAVEENALGFADGIKLAFTRTAADKKKVLAETFGEENVQQVDSEFRVRENGVWKKAETSFLSNITASSPTIAAGVAGSIAGAKAGAAVGTLAGPIGTAVGGFTGTVLGGALSATLAKWGGNEAAEELGIRTETDAQTVRQELAKDFVNNVVWDAALLGAGKAIKPAAKYLSNTSKRAYHAMFDKEGMAATAEKLMPGTKKVDWSAVLRSPEDAKTIMQDMDDVVKWQQKSAKGEVRTFADPATEKMARLATSAMSSFKKKASEQYQGVMNAIESNGQFAKAKVKIDDVFTGYEQGLKQLGLVDDAGRFVTNPMNMESENILQVFDAKSRKTLKEVWGSLSNAAQREGELSFSDAKKLLNGIDDIIESSGYYKGGEMAISNQARRTLKGIRSDIRSKLSSSLSDKYILLDGKRVSASTLYDNATSKYAKFREHYDDFAIPNGGFGGDKRQINATIQKMLGEGGYALEESFGNLAKSVGADGSKVMQRLQQLRAAKNLSNAYSSGSGVTNVASGILGYGSPRVMAEQMAKRSVSMGRNMTPASPKAILELRAIAKTNEFFKNLAPEARQQILSSPELYRGMAETMFMAPELSSQAEEQLLTPLKGEQ